MLRIWRIAGIVVFALLVGLAASSLRGDEDAIRFQADIALLAVSLPAFAVLGIFELTRVRRLERRRRKHRFGGHPSEEVLAEEFDPGSADIYAMPKTLEDWKGGRHSRSSGTRHRRGKKMKSVWMSALQVFCVAIPLVHMGLLLAHLPWDGTKGAGTWTMPFVFLALFLFSVAVAVGVFSMRLWGLVLGYLLVLGNLLLFPYGTAMGLLLLLCLVGSSPIFFAIAHDHRHGSHRSR